MIYKNVSEEVSNLYHNKTAGLLSFHCLTKDFKVCKIDMQAYDPLGNLVMTESDAETGTYKIQYHAPGEFKLSFYNKDVVGFNKENRETNITRT